MPVGIAQPWASLFDLGPGLTIDLLNKPTNFKLAFLISSAGIWLISGNADAGLARGLLEIHRLA